MRKLDRRQRGVGKLGVVLQLLSFCYLLSLGSVSPTLDMGERRLMVVTSFGTLQEYYLNNQLRDHTKSDVAYVPPFTRNDADMQVDIIRLIIRCICRILIRRTVFRFPRFIHTHHDWDDLIRLFACRYCIL